MSDHPTTFAGEPADTAAIQWNDRASVHHANDGGGVIDGAKGLASGTLAEMVAHVMAYPEAERDRFVVEKAGDHSLSRGEIEALAARPDFPL